MAYLRWSFSDWYVFDHVTEGEPILAIWPAKGLTGVYTKAEVVELRDALNEWLEDIKKDESPS